MGNELKKLLRVYTLLIVLIFGIFALWAGITQARNNTRKIAFGENYVIIKSDDFSNK